MRRASIVIVATAIATVSFAGCGRGVQPTPLSSDERQEFVEQLEEADRMELEGFDSARK